MRFLISSQLSPHRYKTPEGYLVCLDCVLARTGSQDYRSNELWEDGDDSIVHINRPSNEVFSDKTLASFENKPFVDEHPDVDVNPSNHAELSKGFVRDIRRGTSDNGEEVMIGNIIVTDPETIDKIENNEKVELSCGYDCDIVKDDNGNYNQINIRGNHVALCEQGRAGIARIVDSNNVKDSVTNQTKRYIEHELKSSIYDILEQRDVYLQAELESIEEWRELSEEEKEYARHYLKNEIFEGKNVLKKFSDSVKDRSNTTIRQFRQSDIDEEGSWYGTTEWGTPKGAMLVYRKNGKIIAESKDPYREEFKEGTKKEFNSLQELNNWLLHDSVNDDIDINSTIDKLIADEEEAIRGYEEAMKNADEKHKALYSHIITEELEHIEELKNMKELNVADSKVKDMKTTIVILGDFKIVDNDVYYKNKLIKECSSVDSAKHYINHYKKENNL